jgi:hypothetical protein
MTDTNENHALGLMLDSVNDAVVSDAKSVQTTEPRVLGPHEGGPH